jgi:hypothetical protein
MWMGADDEDENGGQQNGEPQRVMGTMVSPCPLPIANCRLTIHWVIADWGIAHSIVRFTQWPNPNASMHQSAITR